ncbi:hypothetical protein [Micromonospora sp. NPDC005806]|uniref:hypothetical protein n=1 Tax=Micromonospora sp. NPDC005806 TaxID=3364234 RepID=UPI0036BC33F7
MAVRDLRTGSEQGALLDGFGRFLNSVTGPAQIVVAAQRHIFLLRHSRWRKHQWKALRPRA